MHNFYGLTTALHQTESLISKLLFYKNVFFCALSSQIPEKLFDSRLSEWSKVESWLLGLNWNTKICLQRYFTKLYVCLLSKSISGVELKNATSLHLCFRVCVCVNKWWGSWADGQVLPGYLSSEWTHWQCHRSSVQGAEPESVSGEGALRDTHHNSCQHPKQREWQGIQSA